MTRIQHGPGPIIQGQDITNPERFIVQQAGVPGVQVMSQAEIAAIPIRHQWFSGTANGHSQHGGTATSPNNTPEKSASSTDRSTASNTTDTPSRSSATHKDDHSGTSHDRHP